MCGVGVGGGCSGRRKNSGCGTEGRMSCGSVDNCRGLPCPLEELELKLVGKGQPWSFISRTLLPRKSVK